MSPTLGAAEEQHEGGRVSGELNEKLGDASVRPSFLGERLPYDERLAAEVLLVAMLGVGRKASWHRLEGGLIVVERVEASLRELGTASFHQVERITLSSMTDVAAYYEARRAEVSQTLREGAEGYVAELRVEHHGPDGAVLNTHVALPPDRPVIVGATGRASNAAGARPTLFYVVRARPVGGGA